MPKSSGGGPSNSSPTDPDVAPGRPQDPTDTSAAGKTKDTDSTPAGDGDSRELSAREQDDPAFITGFDPNEETQRKAGAAGAERTRDRLEDAEVPSAKGRRSDDLTGQPYAYGRVLPTHAYSEVDTSILTVGSRVQAKAESAYGGAQKLWGGMDTDGTFGVIVGVREKLEIADGHGGTVSVPFARVRTNPDVGGAPETIEIPLSDLEEAEGDFDDYEDGTQLVDAREWEGVPLARQQK